MTNNRKLVPVEQAVELLNRRAASYNVVTISRIKGYLGEEILRQALDLVQARHPRLNSRIVGSLDNLQFETEGTQKIPLRVVNTFHREQWQDVVHEEMNEKLDSSKVLLRTTLVRMTSETNTSYLLTTVHHAITDALSSIQLHAEILTYCQNLASGKDMIEVHTLPALPPIEELLPESMKGFRGTLNSMGFLLRLTLKQLWNPPKTLGFEQYVPIELRRCGMVHRQLDEELTQKLVNCCRKEKTTVQGALCAAMLLAAARKITAVNQTDVRVSCQSFVDLRQRLKPVVSDEDMGLLASFLSSFHTLRTNPSFWELARDVKQQLDAGLKRSDIFVPVLLFKTMSESLLAHPDQVPVTVALTNVGRVNIPKVYGSFELEEISFVPAQAVFGGVFGAAVATFEGKMLLNFVFSEPSISREMMESLADSVISCIVDVCKNSTSTQQPSPEPTKLTSSGI
ncbi:phthiocerol/phthiodiolone dimycocerosyl transferase family protein [Coleofasciculus sp.]|uniref:phthiocerol/phthiodiolone dimycocerosyl transferase family protein n=1 Tax=Coleofasciculus sp. TaxID=3100458 RepID=UPI003A17F8E6